MVVTPLLVGFSPTGGQSYEGGGVHIDPDCFEKFQDWVNFEVSKRLSL